MACLDTSFLIDVLEGAEAARDVFDDLRADGVRHAVSPVSASELYVGAHGGSRVEYERAVELLESLRWLELDRATARAAGRLQSDLIDRGEPIGFTDCLIAAAAIQNDEQLVTADDDFERIDSLRTRRY